VAAWPLESAGGGSQAEIAQVPGRGATRQPRTYGVLRRFVSGKQVEAAHRHAGREFAAPPLREFGNNRRDVGRGSTPSNQSTCPAADV
jgi:hypothetical protein